MICIIILFRTSTVVWYLPLPTVISPEVLKTYPARIIPPRVKDVDFKGKYTLKSEVKGIEGSPSLVGMKAPVPIPQ